MSLLRHWKIMLCLLIVFAAGLTIGSAATVEWIQRAYRQRMDPASWTPRTMAWLQSDLPLSESEAAAVRPEVEKSMRQLNDLRLEANQRRKQIFGEMLAEISRHLSDSQRERLHAAVQKAIARQAASETAP